MTAQHAVQGHTATVHACRMTDGVSAIGTAEQMPAWIQEHEATCLVQVSGLGVANGCQRLVWPTVAQGP